MALSDIISALSKAEFNEYLFAGHSAEYWSTDANIGMELFANINSIEVLEYDSLKEIKELFQICMRLIRRSEDGVNTVFKDG